MIFWFVRCVRNKIGIGGDFDRGCDLWPDVCGIQLQKTSPNAKHSGAHDLFHRRISWWGRRWSFISWSLQWELASAFNENDKIWPNKSSGKYGLVKKNEKLQQKEKTENSWNCRSPFNLTIFYGKKCYYLVNFHKRRKIR